LQQKKLRNPEQNISHPRHTKDYSFTYSGAVFDLFMLLTVE